MADETDPDLEGSENMSDIPVLDENEDDKDGYFFISLCLLE